LRTSEGRTMMHTCVVNKNAVAGPKGVNL
jgi:hypothetical protein